jgi:ankyrin repeat protein
LFFTLCLTLVPVFSSLGEEADIPPAAVESPGNENIEGMRAAVDSITDIPSGSVIVEESGDIEDITAPVFTSLLQAVAAKDLYASKDLIEGGAVADESDDQGKNALLLASENEMPEVIMLLVERGDNLMAQDEKGNTALHLAARANDVYTIDMLVEMGIPLHSMNERDYTPFFEATDAGGVDSCRRFVELGEDPLASFSDERYFCAFHAAAVNEHWDITALFREMGFKPDVFMDAGLGDLPAIKWYAEHEPDQLSLMNQAGQSVMISAMGSGNPKVVEVMLDAGVRLLGNMEGETPPSLATRAGRKEVLDLFFKHGVSPDSRDSSYYGWTLLCHAAMDSNLDMMDFLISRGARLGYPSAKGDTPIHIAVDRSLGEVFNFLLDRGAVLESRRADAYTPLHLAAEKNNTVMAEQLLTLGARLQVTEKRRWTPLHIAADAGHEGMIRFLLSQGADTDAADKQGRTPLNLAVAKGHLAVAKLLLETGADPDISDEKSRASLHTAALLGDTKLIRVLLDSGAVIDATDEMGRTPLFIALQEDHYAAARMLAEAGASLEVENQESETLLFPAATNEDAQAVRWLVDHKLDVNTVNAQGRTPLHLAALRGCEDTIKILMEEGALVNAVDNDGNTPLHLASERGQIININHLVSNGADFHIRNRAGCLPLHYSATNGHWGPIQMFLLRGVPVNEPDGEGNTALHRCLQGGFHRTASLLLTRGADFTQRNVAGETPMDVLKKSKAFYENLKEPGSRDKATKVALAHSVAFFQGVLLDELCNTVERKDEEFLRQFLDAYPELKDGALFGSSALYRAVALDNLPMTQLLLERGADPNIIAPAKNKERPLHRAAEHGNPDMVELLLQAGARPDLADASGVTPLSIARRSGRKDLMAIMAPTDDEEAVQAPQPETSEGG